MPTAHSSGAHRQNYTPERQPRSTPRDKRIALIGLSFTLLLGLVCFGGLLLEESPITAAIAAPAIVATPMPPLAPLDTQQLTDARVEGFRAGLAEGLGQGCTQPQRLTLPIATR